MKKLFLIHPVLLFFTLCAGGARVLECSHLHDIQSKYLDLHIHYSNSRGRGLFKNQMAQVERRLRDQLVKALDSDKVYFTTRDVRNIRRRLTGIFKKIKKRDCSDLNSLYDLYRLRVEERIGFARRYVEDLTLDPSLKVTLDPKKRKRASTASGLNQFYARYIQYRLANAMLASSEKEKSKQMEEAKKNILSHYSRLKKRIHSWSVHLSPSQKRKCLKRKSLTDRTTFCKPYKWYAIYLDSFARSLDPHSGYLSQEDHEDFEINMRLSLEGIGATLYNRYGHTMIDRLVPGGAAARSGKLQPKDKILAVGQSKKKLVNIFDMDLRDVVSLIRGRKNTPVYLKILRTEGETKENKIFVVRVVRDRIHLQDQAATRYYFDRKVGEETKKVAVLMVPSFYGEGRMGGRSVSRDLRVLLREAKRKKVDSVVLDLSGNGGGALSEAVRVAGLFFAKGNVVRQLVKTKNGDRYLTLSDVDKGISWAGPLVVLVNRVSASASEIVSGTLKSYRRAVIVGGDHTFGKGSIQSVEPLGRGFGSIRVTVGLFFIPNGFSTQLRGVPSDIRFPSVFSTNEIGEKTLDYVLKGNRIPGFLSNSAYVFKGESRWDPLSPSLIKWLQKKSSQRVKKGKKFLDIQKDIAKIQAKQSSGYRMSIGEVFDEAKKEGEPGFEKRRNRKERVSLDRKALEKQYRERADIQEAVNIAADMVTEGAPSRLARQAEN